MITQRLIIFQAYTARQRQKHSMLEFPSAPSMLPPDRMLQNLMPDRPDHISPFLPHKVSFLVNRRFENFVASPIFTWWFDQSDTNAFTNILWCKCCQNLMDEGMWVCTKTVMHWNCCNVDMYWNCYVSMHQNCVIWVLYVLYSTETAFIVIFSMTFPCTSHCTFETM